MKPSTNSKPFFYFTLLLVIALTAGCGPSQKQIAAQTETGQTEIAALWTPTFTTTATSTATATATATATVKPTAVPTLTPTQAPSLTPTSEPTEDAVPAPTYTVRDVTFSFRAPDGWEKASNDPNTLLFTGPMADETQDVLTFSVDQYSPFGEPMDADDFGIAFFSAHVQDTLAEMVTNGIDLSEGFGKTSRDENYFYWIMEHDTNGKHQQLVFYIFGSGKSFLTIMYGRPVSTGAENDALIEAAMNTLVFEQ